MNYSCFLINLVDRNSLKRPILSSSFLNLKTSILSKFPFSPGCYLFGTPLISQLIEKLDTSKLLIGKMSHASSTPGPSKPVTEVRYPHYEKNAEIVKERIAEITKMISDIELAKMRGVKLSAISKNEQPHADEAISLLAQIDEMKDKLTLLQIRNGKPYISSFKSRKNVNLNEANLVQSSSSSAGDKKNDNLQESSNAKENLAGAPSSNAPSSAGSGAKKSEKSKNSGAASSSAGSSKGGGDVKTTQNETKNPQNNEKGGGEEMVDVSRLDFRVGKIVECAKHPDADSLYVEKIDVGEPIPRTVVSGLVKHVPIEEMTNRFVVLLCNLKAAKMRGVTSEAMVMCASTPEKVEILTPPPGSTPGDLVSFKGFPRTPDSVLNPKKKIFETVAPFLKTNEKGIAMYKEVPFEIEGKGTVTSHSLFNVNIK